MRHLVLCMRPHPFAVNGLVMAHQTMVNPALEDHRLRS